MRWMMGGLLGLSLALAGCNDDTDTDTDTDTDIIDNSVDVPLNIAHLIVSAPDPLTVAWVAEGDFSAEQGPLSYLWSESTTMTLPAGTEWEVDFHVLDNMDAAYLNFSRTIQETDELTVFLMGIHEGVGASAPQAVWHSLDPKEPADGLARVQLVHGAVSSPKTYDLYLGQTLVAEDLSYTELADAVDVTPAENFIGVEAGDTPDFDTPANNPIYIGSIDLAAGGSYVLTLIDANQGANTETGLALVNKGQEPSSD